MESAPLLGGAGHRSASYAQIAEYFGILGWTAFGGPNAHIGMYQNLFVKKLQWLDDQVFAEILALGQCLPGPTSTQMSYAIGIYKNGPLAGLMSGLLFMLPGAIIMTAMGFGSTMLSDISVKGTWQNCAAAGLSAAGLSLVAIAAKNLSTKLCVTNSLAVICTASAVVSICYKAAWLFPVIILGGGLLSLAEQLVARWGKLVGPDESQDAADVRASTRTEIAMSICLVIVFLAVLVGSTAAAKILPYEYDTHMLFVFQVFCFTGSLVYGGGPVVLPMLLAAICDDYKWMTHEEFLTGLGIAQAMPGPMFNLSAYLGAVIARHLGHHVLVGSLTGWTGMFFPGVILIFAAMPLWSYIRNFKAYKAMLPGLNAAAAGLIVSSVFSMYEILRGRSAAPNVSTAIALVGAVAVDGLKVPAPLAVIGGGCLGLLARAAGL